MKLCLRRTGHTDESYANFSDAGEGQFLCLSDDCTFHAKFDDDKPTSFSGTEAAGGKTTMLFIDSTPRLISDLRKAKVLKLQAPVYEDTGTVYHFNVSGLKWP